MGLLNSLLVVGGTCGSRPVLVADVIDENPYPVAEFVLKYVKAGKSESKDVELQGSIIIIK